MIGRERWVSKHGVAYLIVGMVLMFVLVMLPFASRSIAHDILDPHGQAFLLTPPRSQEGIVYRIHLEMLSISEVENTVAFKVTAFQDCEPHCTREMRFRLVSGLFNLEHQATGLPTSEVITFKPETVTLNQTIRFPLDGDAIRYPFDAYKFELSIIQEQTLPDGSQDVVLGPEAREQVVVTIQSRIPRLQMKLPGDSGAEGDPFAVVFTDVRFQRPLYLKVLTLMLVVLVTSAAAFAVFMRPLDQLVINSGALVLGVWGIRAILLGTGVAVVTAVDLSLSLVILFLLVSITARTLWLLEERAGFRVLRRGRTPSAPSPPLKPPGSGSAVTVADLVPEAHPAERDVADVVPERSERSIAARHR